MTAFKHGFIRRTPLRWLSVFGLAYCVSVTSAYAVPGGLSVMTKAGPGTYYATANKGTLIYGGRDATISQAQQASLSRAYGMQDPATYSVGVFAKDTVGMKLGGAVIDVVATRLISTPALPAIGAGVLLLGCSALCPSVSDWMLASGIGRNPSSGELEETVGAQTPTSYYWNSHSPAEPLPKFATTTSACQSSADYLRSGSASYGWFYRGPATVVSESEAGGMLTCVVSYSYKRTSSGATESSTSNRKWIKVGSPGCRGLTNQWFPLVGGACPAGTRQPIAANPGGAAGSVGAVAHLLGKVNAPNAPGVVSEAVKNAVEVPASNPTVSGPASAPGPTTTKTGPAGTTSTVVTNNYTYEGDTVTVTQTTVVNHPDGTTETTTTDDVKPEETSPCELDPDLLMCQKLDEPDGGEIPKETKNVTFAAENPFGDGQCPADASMTFGSIGKTAVVVDWTTFCGWALPVRGLVLAMASLMAMFIIMPGGVRE